jgi:hypothetical protein
MPVKAILESRSYELKMEIARELEIKPTETRQEIRRMNRKINFVYIIDDVLEIN